MKEKTEHLFDHEAKKLAFVMQVYELDYVFDSPHLRNAFDPHSIRTPALRSRLGSVKLMKKTKKKLLKTTKTTAKSERRKRGYVEELKSPKDED